MNWNDTDIGFQPITNHSIFVELTLDYTKQSFNSIRVT